MVTLFNFEISHAGVAHDGDGNEFRELIDVLLVSAEVVVRTAE